MKTSSLSIAVVGSAALVSSVDAGFLGFVAFAKQNGVNVFVDVFCAVQNSRDTFFNTFNVSSSGTFVQQAGITSKAWKPEAFSFTSSRSSVDSFMTAGCYSGAAYGGEYYASANTNADPAWVGTTWSTTPTSAAVTWIPAYAGWFTGDPTVVDNGALLLSAFTNGQGYTRFDSFATAGQGTVGGTVGSAGATYGIWCAHLVIAGSMPANTAALNTMIGGWIGAASIKDGVTAATSQGYSSFVPAPGAIALVGIAGFASRRCRADP